MRHALGHRVLCALTTLVFPIAIPGALVARAADEPAQTIAGIGPAGSIESVHTGLTFGEGPAADFDGQLYFTDVFANRILKANPGAKPAAILENSQAANGLMFSRPGTLIACQGGSGKIISIDVASKEVSVVVDAYNGNRFLRPNDLVVDKQGGVYFTDPKIGSGGTQDKAGVYYATKEAGATRLADDLLFPNGIILSPDEKTLYVLQYSAAEAMAYAVTAPGKIGPGRVFFKLPQKSAGNKAGGDGLTIDTNGNLYITVPALKSLAVVSPEGKQLGMIPLPAVPTNCAFAGADMKTLYVTTAQVLYRLPMEATGHRFGAAK